MNNYVYQNYVRPQKSGMTFALFGDVRYSEYQSKLEQSSGCNQIYAFMEDIQVGSISWRKQDTMVDRELEQRFKKLAQKWKRETVNISSIQQMVLHPAYQEIIAMGSKVIPMILNELKRKPDFWFWALRSLTRTNPVTKEMRGDLMAMREAWLDWESKNAYL